MSEREVKIERVENGYVVTYWPTMSTKQEVYVTLQEALKRAGWILDYRKKLVISEVPDEK